MRKGLATVKEEGKTELGGGGVGEIVLKVHLKSIQPDLIYPTLVYPKTSFIRPSVENPHHYVTYNLCTLIYPTTGLSDTFCKEQMWSDKRGPTVFS